MSLDPSIICVVKGGNMILRRTGAEGTASFAEGIWLIFPRSNVITGLVPVIPMD